MKEHLVQLLQEALLNLKRQQKLDLPTDLPFTIERTRSREHGDFASNIALVLARHAKLSPMDLGALIVKAIPESRQVDKVDLARPGFINFTANRTCLLGVLKRISDQGADYGRCDAGEDEPITVEYVSANPTGPLHVGHGRMAAFGASLTAILAHAGYDVQREYYVNDYGRQMDILATSVWLRYLELTGQPARFPDNGYRGDYVIEVARQLRVQEGDALRLDSPAELVAGLPPDESEGGDKETHVDALIARARALLGAGYERVYDFALARLRGAIREELGAFGVQFDEWCSERGLARSGAIEAALEQMRGLGHLYEKDGALWFRSSELGDEKDRVVVRENGQSTYFASDIAYLKHKFDRGFAKAVYVLGADHHGYIGRLKAAARGLGLDPDRVEIVLVQFVYLYKDGVEVAMGKREGKFVTLRDLRDEVGNDAARFFYVMRSHEQSLDFDLELAKKQSADNPVFYVQYAHARICAVFRKLEDRGLPKYIQATGEAARTRLTEDREVELVTALLRLPETIENAARLRAPHILANYLRDVAAALHAYYDGEPRIELLCDDDELRNARLLLLASTRQVLANGLKLLGVSAPDVMERKSDGAS